MKNAAQKDEIPVVKKYANRRLYDTETSAYITLEDLCERVKAGRDFVVQDAKTGADLTNQVLTQIILEQEIKGFNLLPTPFLRSVIRMYDDQMTAPLQHYLNASMMNFNNNREEMQSMFSKAMGDFSPVNQFEEMTRNNMAMFEKTVGMFNPFGASHTEANEPKKAEPKAKRAKRS